MNADEKALAIERMQGYREGYVAGYGAGATDGRAQGFSDAKFRAHVSVRDLPDAVKRLNASVGTHEEE